jgi:PIN domain nuclease of toxin-antitoxin system
VRALVDTHVLLWSLQQPERLSRTILDIFRDADTQIVVSVAVLWEVAIKTAVGKLQAPPNLPDHVLSLGHEVLTVDARHAWRVQTLPMHHHDPFDRLLIAQAQVENLALMTHDRLLERYDVRIIRA